MHKPQSTTPTINVSVETGRNAAASNRGQDVSAPRLVYVLTIALGLVTTAAILGWMMMLARRGIDFSDEGYHLNFIANPGIYSASVTQFGFFYHPLFELVSEKSRAIEAMQRLFDTPLGLDARIPIGAPRTG